jgi:hypothetical protein
MGYLIFRLPVGPSYFVPIQVNVLKVNNPFLLGLNDMKSMKMLIEVEAMTLKVDGSPELPLLEKEKHIWLRIPSTDSSCFTKSELHQLHNRMGHPQAERLLKFLKLSAPDQFDDETKKNLESIADQCTSCQRTRHKPYVFKVAAPDDTVFGHELLIDIAKMDGKYFLHVVDRGTGFTAAKVLDGESSRIVWEGFTKTLANKIPNYERNHHGCRICIHERTIPRPRKLIWDFAEISPGRSPQLPKQTRASS